MSLAPVLAPTGFRRLAVCTKCGAAERHRVAASVISSRIQPYFLSRPPKTLHFAPESSISPLIQAFSASYETADLEAPGVDHQVDLIHLPFEDNSYDLIFASHVLEHIADDAAALSEIARILRPGGLAVLPVPIVQESTTEYPAPNPREHFHVRAPGTDYFDRYKKYFSSVEVIPSKDLPAEVQPFVYENRTKWPTKEFPYRQSSPGRFHSDFMPLCWK